MRFIRKRSEGRTIAALLIISCLYKIAVVKGGVLERLLMPLVNHLPLSEVSRYTNTISIVKLYALGLSLHAVCMLFWLVREKGKIWIRKSQNEISLLLLFFVRFASELYAHKGAITPYNFVYDILCFIILFMIYQNKNNPDLLDKVQESATWSIFGIGFVCSIFAFVYFLAGLQQSFSNFNFRQFRIGGFLFDSILAGFFYGLGTISSIALYNQKRISKLLFFVSLFFMLVGCFLTGSRASFYFLILAVGYYFGSNRGYSRVLILALIAVLIVFFYQSILSESEISFTSDEARSYKSRLAFQLFLSHSISGVGSNMFHNYDPIYGSNPHNLPLTILAENGIIGFIPYAIWAITNIINIIRTKNHYWKWLCISFMVLSMILGTLTNMITVILMILSSWSCEATKPQAES